jgi:short-subunit dehydrogenase
MKLDHKTVLLTGATGGIGRAIATALAARGASLILSSRKQTELEQLAASMPGTRHRVIASDLAEEGAALKLLEAAGDIDVLVANAALPGSGRLESFSHAEIDRLMRVNLDAPIRMTRDLMPVFLQRNSGHFVYVSSISGRVSTPRASLYAATKFGLRGFAFCLREDLHDKNIGVSVVTPGAIRDAGMYAQSGAPAPPGIGTSSPEQVGDGVVEAIERNRREVTVAPARQRLISVFAANAPELAGRLAGSVAAKIADQVAEGQAHMR